MSPHASSEPVRRMSLSNKLSLMLTTNGRASATKLTREEMREHRLPLQYRDGCAHMLAPLNRCRFETYHLPWKCVDERHAYEKCQYDNFLERVAKMKELKAENPGKRSN